MKYVALILIFCWGCSQPAPKPDKPKIDTALSKTDTTRKQTWSEQIDGYNYINTSDKLKRRYSRF